MEMQWPATVMAKRAVCDAPKYGMVGAAAAAALGLPTGSSGLSSSQSPSQSPSPSSSKSPSRMNSPREDSKLGGSSGEVARTIHEQERFEEIAPTWVEKLTGKPNAGETPHETIKRNLQAIKADLSKVPLDAETMGKIILLVAVITILNLILINAHAAFVRRYPDWLELIGGRVIQQQEEVYVIQEQTKATMEQTEALRRLTEKQDEIIRWVSVRPRGSTIEPPEFTNQDEETSNILNEIKTLLQRIDTSTTRMSSPSSTTTPGPSPRLSTRSPSARILPAIPHGS